MTMPDLLNKVLERRSQPIFIHQKIWSTMLLSWSSNSWEDENSADDGACDATVMHVGKFWKCCKVVKTKTMQNNEGEFERF